VPTPKDRGRPAAAPHESALIDRVVRRGGGNTGGAPPARFEVAAELYEHTDAGALPSAPLPKPEKPSHPVYVDPHQVA
jgi:hypothetical protein